MKDKSLDYQHIILFTIEYIESIKDIVSYSDILTHLLFTKDIWKDMMLNNNIPSSINHIEDIKQTITYFIEDIDYVINNLDSLLIDLSF